MSRTGPDTRSHLAVIAAVASVAVALGITLPGQASGSHTVAARPASALPTLAAAADFMRAEMRLKNEGNWSAAWNGLYPLHQRVALRRNFVYCEATSPFPAKLEHFQVVGARRSLVHVPGLAHRVQGATVTLRVALAWYGPRDPIVFTHAFHLVPARGHWTWLLSAARYRLYERATCAAAPAA